MFVVVGCSLLRGYVDTIGVEVFDCVGVSCLIVLVCFLFVMLKFLFQFCC